MKHNHVIGSLKHIQPKELQLLKTDSQINKNILDTILNYLLSDYITSVDCLALHRSMNFTYAGTMDDRQIQKHCHEHHTLLKIFRETTWHCQFKVIDNVALEDEVFILIDRFFIDCKKTFIFSIQASYLNCLSTNEKIALYFRLNAVIRYWLNTMCLKHYFYLAGAEAEMVLPEVERYYDNSDEVLSKHCLSLRQLAMLSYIAQGCSSKSIANYLDVSYRTVEVHIKKLIKQLNLGSKKSLENIASIIIQHLQPRFMISDL